MIEPILKEINGHSVLQAFAKVNGLCEMITEPQTDGDENETIAKFPALYNGNDNLRYVTNIDYKAGVVFHLLNGDQNQTDLESRRVAQKRIERTYPLKAIAIIRRSVYGTDSPYSATELLNNLSKVFNRINYGVLKNELNVDSIETAVTGASQDKEAILEDHFENIDFPAIHDLIVVQINYEIIIQGAEICFINYGCS